MHRAALTGLLALAVVAAGEAGAQATDPAKLLGTWVGRWERSSEHELVITKADARGAVFVYKIRGAGKEEMSRGKRYEGVMVDGVLYGKLASGAQVTYVLSPDGATLVGHYARDGKTRRADLTRR